MSKTAELFCCVIKKCVYFKRTEFWEIHFFFVLRELLLKSFSMIHTFNKFRYVLPQIHMYLSIFLRFYCIYNKKCLLFSHVFYYWCYIYVYVHAHMCIYTYMYISIILVQLFTFEHVLNIKVITTKNRAKETLKEMDEEKYFK